MTSIEKMTMKYCSLYLIAFVLVFTSCEKDKQIRTTTCLEPNDYDYLDRYKVGAVMCMSDLCSEYLVIWEELIKEKNNLSQEFFENHIELCESGINHWADGISFRICYKFKIGWAIAYNCDQFIIKIKADNKLYPSLDLPRDIYLTKEEIKIAVDHSAFSSELIKITNVNNLKFSTMENALSDLIKFSGVNKLCVNQITINKDNGDLILKAFAQYENEENSCIEGIIDLISGDKNINDTPCRIN